MSNPETTLINRLREAGDESRPRPMDSAVWEALFIEAADEIEALRRWQTIARACYEAACGGELP